MILQFVFAPSCRKHGLYWTCMYMMTLHYHFVGVDSLDFISQLPENCALMYDQVGPGKQLMGGKNWANGILISWVMLQDTFY